MNKIEFDYSQGRFLIESDDTAFIKEYTEIFFNKLSNDKYNSNSKIKQLDKEIKNIAPVIDGNSVSSNITSNDNNFDIIDLFGINSKQLAYLIDFSNDTIKIIIRNKFIKGTKAEMQVKLSLLYCGACEYKGVKANTKDIRNICTTYQCLDGNFAQNIKRENNFNISGAVNADICLTMPGKDKLLDVVKEIVSAMELN